MQGQLELYLVLWPKKVQRCKNAKLYELENEIDVAHFDTLTGLRQKKLKNFIGPSNDGRGAR
jgi:hypothetical protein